VSVPLIKYFETFSAPLIGLPVTHYWLGHESTLFIEFGALTIEGRRSQPRGRMTLQLQWDWRLEGRRTILCGRTTDAAISARSLRLLKSGVVRSVGLVGYMKELEVFLTNDLRLQSFSCSRGDPQWCLLDNRERPTLYKCLGARSLGLVAQTFTRTPDKTVTEEFIR